MNVSGCKHLRSLENFSQPCTKGSSYLSNEANFRLVFGIILLYKTRKSSISVRIVTQEEG
jgi:hypothetical protein